MYLPVILKKERKFIPASVTESVSYTRVLWKGKPSKKSAME